jgi:hypothetical protein
VTAVKAEETSMTPTVVSILAVAIPSLLCGTGPRDRLVPAMWGVYPRTIRCAERLRRSRGNRGRDDLWGINWAILSVPLKGGDGIHNIHARDNLTQDCVGASTL